MKKYIVIGNPIEHSLSPELHNYWIKKNKIDAFYDKKLINEENIKNIIDKIKKEEIHGINVTVPFKKLVIPFLDQLSPEAKKSQSVNTIYLENKKIIGHNTDIVGFELSLRHLNYDVKDKQVTNVEFSTGLPSTLQRAMIKYLNSFQMYGDTTGCSLSIKILEN